MCPRGSAAAPTRLGTGDERGGSFPVSSEWPLSDFPSWLRYLPLWASVSPL